MARWQPCWSPECSTICPFPIQPHPPRSELPSGICIQGAESCLSCGAVLTNWNLRALLWCLLL